MKTICTLVLAVAATILIGMLASCDSHNNRSANMPKETNSDTSHPASVAVETTRGREIFEEKCQRCHGLSGNYRNNNAADLQLSKIDSTSIIATIKNGKGVMPMFASTIPDSDLAQLALYVKTLRK